MSKIPHVIGLAFCAALAALLASTTQAHAATITVNTALDGIMNDGRCSLREAFQSANTDTAVGGCVAGAGADTIVFDAAGAGGTITVTQAPPTVTTAIALDGTGVRLVLSATVSGPGTFPEIQIASTGALTASHLLIDGVECRFRSIGGSLVLLSSVIRNCKQSGSFGLGTVVNTGGRLWVSDTLFLDNAAYHGAAISNEFGEAHIAYSTFRGNSARSGAAIFNGRGSGLTQVIDITSTLWLTGSVIAENWSRPGADYGKGIITNYGIATLDGNLFAENEGRHVFGFLTSGVVESGGVITLTRNTFRNNYSSLEALGSPSVAHPAVLLRDDGWGWYRGALMRENTFAQSVGVVMNYAGVYTAPITATLEYNTFVNSAQVITNRAPIEVYTHTTLLLNANVVTDATVQQNCLVLGGSLVDLGRNFSSDGACGFSGPGSQNNSAALLGPLMATSERVGAAGDNAFLQVHRPQSTSPACSTLPCAGAVANPAAPLTRTVFLPLTQR